MVAPTTSELLNCIRGFVLDWEDVMFGMHSHHGDTGEEWRERWKAEDPTTPAMVAKARNLLERSGTSSLPELREIQRP